MSHSGEAAGLLDELDRVNTIRKNSGIHWVNKASSEIDDGSNCTFIALAIQAGLRQ
jgi:hypothetical protein